MCIICSMLEEIEAILGQMPGDSGSVLSASLPVRLRDEPREAAVTVLA